MKKIICNEKNLKTISIFFEEKDINKKNLILLCKYINKYNLSENKVQLLAFLISQGEIGDENKDISHLIKNYIIFKTPRRFLKYFCYRNDVDIIVKAIKKCINESDYIDCFIQYISFEVDRYNNYFIIENNNKRKFRL